MTQNTIDALSAFAQTLPLEQGIALLDIVIKGIQEDKDQLQADYEIACKQRETIAEQSGIPTETQIRPIGYDVVAVAGTHNTLINGGKIGEI